MDYTIRIDPEHFDYLKIQKGRLDNLAHDRAAWEKAYLEDLRATYQNLEKYLPGTCERFLDVGSGLGGMDIILRRHYAESGQDPEVHLLDGENDPPKMELHRRTFNSMYYARNFHVKNGCSPLRFFEHSPRERVFIAPFDLIVSFGAWCFHLPPDQYLPALLQGGLHADTVLILELRAGRPDYVRQLEKHLSIRGSIEVRQKWERIVARVKPGHAPPWRAPL